MPAHFLMSLRKHIWSVHVAEARLTFVYSCTDAVRNGENAVKPHW